MIKLITTILILSTGLMMYNEFKDFQTVESMQITTIEGLRCLADVEAGMDVNFCD